MEGKDDGDDHGFVFPRYSPLAFVQVGGSLKSNLFLFVNVLYMHVSEQMEILIDNKHRLIPLFYFTGGKIT